MATKAEPITGPGRALSEWRKRAKGSAAAVAMLPPRVQLTRLAQDTELLDGLVVAAALDLVSPGTRAVLDSPPLAPHRQQSLRRVHAALTPLVPPRVGASHWVVRAVAEVRRQCAEVMVKAEQS